MTHADYSLPQLLLNPIAPCGAVNCSLALHVASCLTHHLHNLYTNDSLACICSRVHLQPRRRKLNSNPLPMQPPEAKMDLAKLFGGIYLGAASDSHADSCADSHPDSRAKQASASGSAHARSGSSPLSTLGAVKTSASGAASPFGVMTHSASSPRLTGPGSTSAIFIRMRFSCLRFSCACMRVFNACMRRACIVCGVCTVCLGMCCVWMTLH